MHRVVITGMGWITPLGHDLESVWHQLLSGGSGIARTTLFEADTFPTQISAEVKNFDLADHLPEHAEHAGAGRNTRFALAACKQAWTQANFNGDLNNDRVGMYFASGEGSLDFGPYSTAVLTGYDTEARELDMAKWADVAFVAMSAMREIEQEPNLPLAHLAKLTGASGPAFNCLTACAASTQAIGEATEILRRGDADVMISGGAHSMIHPLGVTGFNRLTALSEKNENPPAASRPFSADRGGFVLGEGAGVVILETLEHAQARGATILAEVVGYGSTADAYRITDQHPDGTGAVIAMREALTDADLRPTDVRYINAHGTGTRENDGNETRAIKQVFGDDAYNIPVSSIKSMMGHLIAAAGAVELITCVLAMRDGKLPPTANLDADDPECDLDYVPNEARAADVPVAMSTGFGFGGQNDAVVIRRFTD
ncbi:MAG: beta-ketoacyl-[acyl-carrier-protein] synthase family protein [Planctomycetota bacterium]